MTSANKNLACFITPHGFGHAARACAVMAACRSLDSLIHFEIYTQVPRWFFDESLPACFTYHDYPVDVGLVQVSPFSEDLPATIQRLSEFFPPDQDKVDRLAHELVTLGCQLALCDIAPLGISVARAAGIPSVLIENFTWDWIYAAYLTQETRFNVFIPILQHLFASADFHIQTQPICAPVDTAALTTSPVSRSPRRSQVETRAFLGIPESTTFVLISMGGFPITPDRLPPLGNTGSIVYVIPGASQQFERRENLVLLPHLTPIFHPDLVHACDVLIGKSGYSTIAEAYFAGAPFGFISRARFRESGPLSEFIRHEMNGIEITESSFEDGAWIRVLDRLLSQPRRHPTSPNGASIIALFLLSKLKP